MEKKGSITGLLLLQGALALFLVLVVLVLFWLYPNQTTQAGDWLSSKMEEENLWAMPQAETVPTLTAPLNELVVTFAFGEREGEEHQGIDLDAQEGEPVYAALDGTVTTAASSDSYGNWIELTHTDGLSTRYAHCFVLAVKEGDTVSAGDLIALAGDTGDADGVHLHFELLEDGQPVDPSTALGVS